MFQVGDKIVHPMHGAGVIDSIVSKKVNGVDRDEADRLIAAMPDIEVDMTQNWNRRYRENMLRIKSGDLMEVARVVKGLMLRDENRGLSTGERKMLHSAKQILISELVLSQDASYEDVEERINTAMS